ESSSARNSLSSHPDILPIRDGGSIITPACRYAWSTTEAIVGGLSRCGQADIPGSRTYVERKVSEAWEETALENLRTSRSDQCHNHCRLAGGGYANRGIHRVITRDSHISILSYGCIQLTSRQCRLHNKVG